MKVHVTRKAVVVALIAGLTLFALAQVKKPPAFYCKYCGHKASSVASLTASMCIRHPDGPHKGRHALYEGSEKEKYDTCPGIDIQHAYSATGTYHQIDCPNFC